MSRLTFPKPQRAWILMICSLGISCAIVGNTISRPNQKKIPALEFSIHSLSKTMDEQHIQNHSVTFTQNESLTEQSYRISYDSEALKTIIEASDARGFMYGCFEFEEQLQIGNPIDQINNISATPYIKKRGLKFNIPLDARTPSYDDTGDAAQLNIQHIWEFKYWKKYLNQMARHRFNTLTLWNPHPFPSMIKLKDYPDVALHDVCVTTLKPEGFENEWGEPGLVTQEVLKNLKVVKKITIDEKIQFWNKVFDYAKNRGIDVYFYNWNICPNSVATAVKPYYKTYRINMDEEVPGKYGITHQLDNQKTIAYYRECVKQFLLTYPQIKGIGVTAGEHMPLAWNGYNREQWLWETYGLGILDIKAIQPNRKIDFVHRVWHSDMEQIMNYWSKYPDSFELSFKYAKARLYSNPDLPFSDSHVEETSPYNLKTWWNLRNDDIYVYRWGDPEYVKSFIKNIPIDHTAGIQMGSDGYVWWKVFNVKNQRLSEQMEIDKHWNRFFLWGRLSYNPDLKNNDILKSFNKHYHLDSSSSLFDALQCASKGIPLINCYHWRDWDHMWSVESCSARPKLGGFRTVFDFVETKTMQTSGYLSPSEYAKNPFTSKKSPFQVTTQLRSFVKESIEHLKKIELDEANIEVAAMIEDIKALNELTLYYADKIDAATYLSLFQHKGELDYHDASIVSLKRAIKHWEIYRDISNSNYETQHLARVHKLDWDQLLDENIEDLKTLTALSQ